MYQMAIECKNLHIFVVISVFVVLYVLQITQSTQKWHQQFQLMLRKIPVYDNGNRLSFINGASLHHRNLLSADNFATGRRELEMRKDRGEFHHSRTEGWNSAYRIAIVEVVEGNSTSYSLAMKSVSCYASVQNYEFHVLNGVQYENGCHHSDKFFRRHCLIARFLGEAKHLDYVLFIDSDIGVVNPKRRIEEFIDERAEIIFYDRFYNWEVMAGSYLVKNSIWSQAFLQGFADYEFRLPNSFHGTDNGALHAYLAEWILPENNTELPICLRIYNESKNYSDLFLYEACIRNALGNSTVFGEIKILPKGMGWARDNWMTNSKWNEERDFMIHNWKTEQLKTYSVIPIPLSSKSNAEWYNPIAGLLELPLCTPGNTSWRYDLNLIATHQEIDDRLREFARDVEEKRQETNSRLELFSNNTLR